METQGNTTLDSLHERLWLKAQEEQRSLRRFFWVLFAAFCIAVVVVSALTVVGPKYIEGTKNESDFLRVVVPIIVVAIGFGVSFLGLKRLEQFDNEINMVRAGLMTQLTEERKLAADDRKQLQALLDNRIRDIADGIRNRAESLVSEALDGRIKAINARITAFESDVEGRITQTVKALEPYLWLKQHESEIESLASIDTVGIAHRQATKLVSEGQTDMAFRVMRYALDKKILGEADDFHNLGVIAARLDDFPLAAAITDNGIRLFPANIDLIADGINYHSKYGNFARCDELRTLLERIPGDYWNWRAYSFLAEYLLAAGQTEEGLRVYEEFQKAHPHEDKAFSFLAKHYLGLGQHHRAVKIALKVTTRTRRCPQSATLLCEAYLELGEYERVIEAADLAIEASAEVQASSSQAAIALYKALAYDALLRQRLHNTAAGGADNPDISRAYSQLAARCVRTYQVAEELGQGDEFTTVIPIRLRLLRALLEDFGFDPELVQQIPDPGARLHAMHELLHRLEADGTDTESDPT